MPETRSVLLDKLNQPFGMPLLGNQLYVATTDAVLRYDYREVMTRIEGEGRKILDLPAGGYNSHWTRNIVAEPRRQETLRYRRLGQQRGRVRHGGGGAPGGDPRARPGRHW